MRSWRTLTSNSWHHRWGRPQKSVSRVSSSVLIWNLLHIIFIWGRRYWQIFKSALVYLFNKIIFINSLVLPHRFFQQISSTFVMDNMKINNIGAFKINIRVSYTFLISQIVYVSHKITFKPRLFKIIFLVWRNIFSNADLVIIYFSGLILKKIHQYHQTQFVWFFAYKTLDKKHIIFDRKLVYHNSISM